MSKDIIHVGDLLGGNMEGPFLPICLCLDTSMSMQSTIGGVPTGEYIEIDGVRGQVVRGGVTRLELLQQGIQQFCQAIFEDELARCTAEFAVVSFDDTARQQSAFSSVESIRYTADGRKIGAECIQIPLIQAGGEHTAMGEGVNLALDLLEARKEDYKRHGIDYYQPWLVLMSDGRNNGSPAEFKRAQQRIQRLVGQDRLAVYPLAIGSRADLSQLNALSPKQKAISLESFQIKPLFHWLAQSTKEVSSGVLGGHKSPKLEYYEVTGWSRDLD